MPYLGVPSYLNSSLPDRASSPSKSPRDVPWNRMSPAVTRLPPNDIGNSTYQACCELAGSYAASVPLCVTPVGPTVPRFLKNTTGDPFSSAADVAVETSIGAIFDENAVFLPVMYMSPVRGLNDGEP